MIPLLYDSIHTVTTYNLLSQPNMNCHASCRLWCACIGVLKHYDSDKKQVIHCMISYYISKIDFNPGGMAASEWTCSVRDVRDTPVAIYSTPGVNTTRCVVYCPPIAISPFLLALSVCYIKQTFWRCGQLWPYVRMGSLGIRMHRDCNGWRCENLSSHSFYIKLKERRKMRRYDTTGPWGSTQWHGSKKFRKEPVRTNVGKDRVCISLYDKTRWKWDAVYLPRGLPNIYSGSLIPPPLPLYLRTPAVAS